jgi:hypothetical protein
VSAPVHCARCGRPAPEHRHLTEALARIAWLLAGDAVCVPCHVALRREHDGRTLDREVGL